MIEQNLQPILGPDYRYQKNSVEMYSLLKEHGRIEDAIRNAKNLEKNFAGRLDYANHNPCTMVHKLVEELLRLKESC